MCDPVAGCVCHRGFIGENCDLHAADAVVISVEPDASSSGLTFVMVILAFVCATAAVLVLLYYRKRVRNLKREIAHVHYTADPNSQPEQQHFDNPVYSYQCSTRSDDSTTLLNNVPHILNNLGGTKVTNTTMERLRMKAGGSNDNYDPMSSMKNKDADAYNPNLYQYDDNKLDHVYDEIKHKEGYEMEYDRLNYTPPANKWKPHYQRMNNGFGSVSNGQPTPPPRDDVTTPPIPPLPKLNIVPLLPTNNEDDSVNLPIPPVREDPPVVTVDKPEENDVHQSNHDIHVG